MDSINLHNTYSAALELPRYAPPTGKKGKVVKEQGAKSPVVNEIRYFRICSDYDAVCDLSEKIYACNEKLGISEEDNIAIRLAFVEAMNNIVEHAYELDPKKYIKVFVNIFTGKIRIIMKDHGKANLFGTDPVKQKISADNKMELPEGGYGFNIIRQVMDRVEYFREGDENTLVLERTFSAS